MHSSDTHARGSGRRGSPLIVHSHLRWDFVWQRPQQLLTRLAAFAPVLFLEEPVFLDDVIEGVLDISVPSANVYRAVPRLPVALKDDYDVAIAHVRTLAISELAKSDGIGRLFREPVQWFYTPMPAPAMLGAFDEVGVAYDCMDELAQFRFAHPDLGRRERLLMDAADVVFTGGHKLYESKSRFHPNVHFFGCGVDCVHFAKASDPRTPIPCEIGTLREAGALVAGYYGVIDERLDYDLIARVAASDPHLHVVMIGPTAKIDPATLPRHPNLRWLGARAYEALPGCVRGFDVCLMPFALNEATEYINPTKTLEYMAAGKPIVSTAVADVVRNFAPVVKIACDAESFVRDVLHEARNAEPDRIAAGMACAHKSSWEAVVHAMNDVLTETIEMSYRVRLKRMKREAAQAKDGSEWAGVGLVPTTATA
jgi:glycosyltransferase involved in cell wall biosynthesis